MRVLRGPMAASIVTTVKICGGGAAVAVALAAVLAAMAPMALAGEKGGWDWFGLNRRSEETAGKPLVATLAGDRSKAATKTEVVAGRSERPILSSMSVEALLGAIALYQDIVSQGGWSRVPAGRYRTGASGPDVAVLKERLYREGYLIDAAMAGDRAQAFTAGTAEAVQLFQANHGLAATGKIDKPTLAALNVSAAERLAALKANLPRVKAYAQDLGARVIVVNIPALQLEAIENGRVFSRHNIIVGKPERPSPVVMANVSDINFNPYWNVPVSIVARDLIPQILREGTRAIKKQDIRIFDGYDGPEVDPDDVDWASTPPERYFFRQDPGAANAMASVKINFPSPFGVYMHDTPTRTLFSSGARYLSSGCVRIDKVHVLVNWILDGQDGWGPNRIEEMADSQERLDVKVDTPPQIRWIYLTAWAAESGHVNFRPDIYDLDGTGFVIGQPMPVGQYSADGQRFILKQPVDQASVPSGAKTPPRKAPGQVKEAAFTPDEGLPFKVVSPTKPAIKPQKQTGPLLKRKPARQLAKPAKKLKIPPVDDQLHAEHWTPLFGQQ